MESDYWRTNDDLLNSEDSMPYFEATRPVVFKRKFEPENVEIEILLEIISQRSL